eukprot:PhF_6_TR18904/c0_g1_i1/m.27584
MLDPDVDGSTSPSDRRCRVVAVTPYDILDPDAGTESIALNTTDKQSSPIGSETSPNRKIARPPTMPRALNDTAEFSPSRQRLSHGSLEPILSGTTPPKSNSAPNSTTIQHINLTREAVLDRPVRPGSARIQQKFPPLPT